MLSKQERAQRIPRPDEVPADDGPPYSIYLYNAAGRYGAPIVIRDASELNPAMFAHVRPHMAQRLKVRVTDSGDNLVFWSENGEILFPQPAKVPIKFRHPEQVTGEIYMGNEIRDAEIWARISQLGYSSIRVGKQAFIYDRENHCMKPSDDPCMVPLFVPVSVILDKGEDPVKFCRDRRGDLVEIEFEAIQHSRNPRG